MLGLEKPHTEADLAKRPVNQETGSARLDNIGISDNILATVEVLERALLIGPLDIEAASERETFLTSGRRELAELID